MNSRPDHNGSSNQYTLKLESLCFGIGCLLPEITTAAYKAVQVALQEAGHDKETSCKVVDQEEFKYVLLLQWDRLDTPKGNLTFRNRKRLAEWAAEGIAFLLVDKLTPYTVVEQAETLDAPGIDYYLGEKDSINCDSVDDFPPHHARLEVSGIMQANTGNSFRRRVKEKIEQTMQSDEEGTPAYVVVIEFHTPLANFTKRTPQNGRQD